MCKELEKELLEVVLDIKRLNKLIANDEGMVAMLHSDKTKQDYQTKITNNKDRIQRQMELLKILKL